jgi:hypothetical protein
MKVISAYIDIQGKDQELIKSMFKELRDSLSINEKVVFPNSNQNCILLDVQFIGDSIYVVCKAVDHLFLKGFSKAFYNIRFSVEAIIENSKAVFSKYYNGSVCTYNSYSL